jgi:hypothetical protein
MTIEVNNETNTKSYGIVTMYADIEIALATPTLRKTFLFTDVARVNCSFSFILI